MKRILFICTGNTCRSPMAEAILKQKLKWAGITTYRVSSAGLSAIDGEKMSKNSFLALKQLGIKSTGFKSKQVTSEMLLKADLILCMTKSHKIALSNYNNVYTLGEFVGAEDIKDPYGQDLTVYIETSHQIEDAVNKLIQKYIL